MPATIQYKDISVMSERNEYLKRLYFLKNTAGRNQIYDRINMLADFYSSTVLLWYEHPLMIITNTKNIFVKRLRRMKKMIASDCSSDESSSQQKSGQFSEQVSFQSSGFLESIKTRQLSSNQLHDKSKSQFLDSSKSFSNSVYDIYEDNTPSAFQGKMIFQLTESIQSKIHQSQQFQIYNKQQSNSTAKSINLQEEFISHLILDIDDISKQKTLRYYKKLEEREAVFRKKNGEDNLIIQLNKNGQKKQNKTDEEGMKLKQKKANIIITPIEYYVPSDMNNSESSFSKEEKYYPKMAPNFTKFSKKTDFNRYHRQEYDETIRVGQRNPKSSRIYGNPNNYRNNFINTHYHSGNQPSPIYKMKKQNIYQKQSDRQTERQYINEHDRYEISERYNIKNKYQSRQNPDNYGHHSHRLPSRIRLQNDQFGYGQTDKNLYSNGHNVHVPMSNINQGNNRWSQRNYYEDTSQFRNRYEEEPLKIKHSKRVAKKQYIRQRALALIQGVKSQDRLDYKPSRAVSRVRDYD